MIAKLNNEIETRHSLLKAAELDNDEVKYFLEKADENKKADKYTLSLWLHNACLSKIVTLSKIQ